MSEGEIQVTDINPGSNALEVSFQLDVLLPYVVGTGSGLDGLELKAPVFKVGNNNPDFPAPTFTAQDMSDLAAAIADWLVNHYSGDSRLTGDATWTLTKPVTETATGTATGA